LKRSCNSGFDKNYIICLRKDTHNCNIFPLLDPVSWPVSHAGQQGTSIDELTLQYFDIYSNRFFGDIQGRIFRSCPYHRQGQIRKLQASIESQNIIAGCLVGRFASKILKKHVKQR
jgi:hypothetical protein